MKKNELLEKLEFASLTEESATTVYLKHLSAITSRVQINPKFIVKAKQIIAFLIKENMKHKKICDDLIDKIKMDKNNDY